MFPIRFKKLTPEELRKLREKLELSQDEFWRMVGITQSRGSRYEKNRIMPDHVAFVVYLVFVRQIDLKDFEQRKNKEPIVMGGFGPKGISIEFRKGG